MKFLPAVVIVAAIQAITMSPRQLVRVARPLEPAEINALLGASRDALAQMTFTLTYLGREDGLQILMREDGWPRLVRSEGRVEAGIATSTPNGAVTTTDSSDYFVHIVDYTGAPARGCDVSAVSGELAITYTHTGTANAWTAHAGTTDRGAGVPICNPVFDVLTGGVPAVSGETTQIDGRTVRGFSAPFSCPPNTYGLDGSAQASQTLFIDVDSLLPVRWQVTAGRNVTDTRVLTYTPLGLRAPDGVAAPRCIP
jgi:hypothetical protein